MCLAIPGKVLKVDGVKAIVDFDGVQREVRVDLVNARKGEYVIVHTGYAIEKLNRKDAEETLKILRSIK
ncbi:MAG: HypC/HybG/HupF family hydrogenase formation chaperone [Candidatus Altiarchaeota archaeon]|nr:HypC/HybG/HupF family hydrogenase formation chaperone [Candidatus Altiarchaeota archaeon]